MNIDTPRVVGRICEFLREQLKEFQRDGAIVGMSGGLDSAVVAALLAEALGPERVLAVLMPDRDSSPDSRTHVLQEVARLGLRHREVDLTPILSKRLLGTRDMERGKAMFDSGLAYARAKHRMRLVVLY